MLSRLVFAASILAAGACDTPNHVTVPTPAHLRYQETDFVALIHFNMGTFAHNGDPCCDATNWNVDADYATGKTRYPSTFLPKKLNTTQWFESIDALGANIAVLTAKHGCGFCLWPTQATLPDGSPYGYSVGSDGAAIRRDVLREFVDSAKEFGIGYGFYYSIMKNFYLCVSISGTNSCTDRVLPGQYNVTKEEYLDIVRTQVTELWTRYGSLTRIWVDSALAGFGDLMVKLQPEAAGTPRSPVGWCGTESGYPSRDVGNESVWSTGDGFHGDPNANFWNPKFCDPQLFQEHVWFWEPNLEVRTLEMLIPIYHDIVGRGMVMEIAFSIDRDGLVQDSHADMYRALGDWVRSCYGTPLASTSGKGMVFELNLPAGTVFDRVQLREDIAIGQRVRNFTISAWTDAVDGGYYWATLATGSAVGRKAIQILGSGAIAAPASGLRLRLTVDHAIATPILRQFAVFEPCASGDLFEADAKTASK